MPIVKYRRDKQKDLILSDIQPGYTTVRKGGVDDYDWVILVSLMKEIRKDGFIRGRLHSGDETIEVCLTDSGALFKENGGYKRRYYVYILNKAIIPAITILITTIIAAII